MRSINPSLVSFPFARYMPHLCQSPHDNFRNTVQSTAPQRVQEHKSFAHRQREHSSTMASSALILALCALTASSLAPVKAPASTQPRNNILSVPERIAQKRQELGDRLPFTTEQLDIEEDT